MVKACTAAKANKCGSEVKESKLLWTQVSGNPNADQQTHTHAQYFVEEQPANVVDDFQKFGPMCDPASNKSWNEFHALFVVLHRFEAMTLDQLIALD